MQLLSNGPRQALTSSLDDPVRFFTPAVEMYFVARSDFPVTEVCAGLVSTPGLSPAL